MPKKIKPYTDITEQEIDEISVFENVLIKTEVVGEIDKKPKYKYQFKYGDLEHTVYTPTEPERAHLLLPLVQINFKNHLKYLKNG